MDDTKAAWWLKLIVLVFTALLLRVALGDVEFEYISPEKKRSLELTFERASFRPATELKKHWKCDMYGVLSKLQVQRGLDLYEWTLRDKAWTNSGAQPVTHYKLANGSLEGIQDRFEDHVRITTDGRLISRLSALAPQKMVVAYAVCTAEKDLLAGAL